MFQAVGLRTYIWNNRLKSVLLLAGFPVLLVLIAFAFALLIAASENPTVEDGFRDAVGLLPGLVPLAVGASLVWFAIAWFSNQWIVDALTGARRVERAEAPRVWNLLENLAISRGMTMPALRIIDTDARNAFASGIREGRYSVTVTRGLVEALDDAELEAVLAHELTHIRNRDTQLLVVSAVFVGIISLVGDLLLRGFRFGAWSGGSSRSSRRSGGKGGGGGAAILILVAIAIFIVARLLAIALRFALSRNREYMADAGAVELTKNPDAMVSALRKIAGHSDVPAPAQIREMYFDDPHITGLSGLFATHPPIEKRIEALVAYAGARDLPPPAPVAPAEPPSESGAAAAPRPAGPWG